MRTPSLLFVYGTLLVALVFQLLPWSSKGVIARPDFMLVVLLYWFFRAPHLCNIGTAWIAGALVDLATGSLLGQHSLAFTLIAYLAISFQRRLVLFNAFQLLFFTFGLLTLNRLTILILKLFSGNELPNLHYFWPVITGVILLQVMQFALGKITQPTSNKAD